MITEIYKVDQKYFKDKEDAFKEAIKKNFAVITLNLIEEMKKNYEYKTCDKCCYDILDDEGDIMEHECIESNKEIEQMESKITYDDTRDIAIRCIDKLIELKLISEDEHHFEIQDLIHDEINEVLGLEMDENEEVHIINYKK